MPTQAVTTDTRDSQNRRNTLTLSTDPSMRSVERSKWWWFQQIPITLEFRSWTNL
jgi:hypothetical protein